MPNSAIPTRTLPSGETVPALGQGTWYMGDGLRSREEEIAALRRGVDLGLTLIDTAEMYGNGASEQLVGEAIAGRRNEVFLVSKVLPSNASKQGTIKACERSLERLGTDHLDLYLLHWRGGTPLRETIEAFEELISAGKIRHWGVSNFDVSDMEELTALRGGLAGQTNQVLYNLTRRGIEWDLQSWCRERQIPIMAYSPIEQGRMLDNPDLQRVADRQNASPAQVALSWLLRQKGVIAIPKAGTAAHVEENRAALDLQLSEDDLSELDQAFPPPRRKQPLDIL